MSGYKDQPSSEDKQSMGTQNLPIQPFKVKAQIESL